MPYMNTTKKGMFGDSGQSGGKSMKKVGMKALRAVGHFMVNTQDGFKAINKQR